MIFERRFYYLLVVAATLSCSADAEPERVEATLRTSAAKRTRFADLGAALTTEEDLVRWSTLRANLRRDFDRICGDTFCEGDYSNYQSLALDCSVDLRRSEIERCVWVFAASQHEVDPTTGAIAVTARHWECALPLAPRTRLKDFLELSSAEQPLYAPLPGSVASANDGLIACL
jgi:hypothetical protein